MAALCRTAIPRIACLRHLHSQLFSATGTVSGEAGALRTKPLLPALVAKSRPRMATTASMQTMEHITDFAIDERKLACEREQPSNLVLILLNYKLPVFTPLLWKQARFRLCADGGANRLYDEFPLLLPNEDVESVRKSYVPDVVKGDLDSVRPEVRSFYQGLGTEIIDRGEDQDTTDLHKCLMQVLEMGPNAQALNLKILVVGALGGRMDHELGNLHVLHQFPHLRIIILSNFSMLFLLPLGFRHVIRPDTSFEGPHCGLLPLATPSESTITTGLQWNLDDRPMSFDKMVSTSNRLAAEEVTVVSDATLLWTTELHLPQEGATSIQG